MKTQVKPRRAWWLLALAASAWMLCGGCSDSVGPTEIGLHKLTWMSQNITDYRYVMQQGCFCPPPVTTRVEVTVSDGVITAVRDVRADSLLSADTWGYYKTIDDLFDLVIRASRDADHLDVDFDDQYGYPTHVDIYWDTDATDNGYVVDASLLQPM